jgi:hypothetical protein
MMNEDAGTEITAKTRKPRERTSKNFSAVSEINLLVTENPKRAGSKAHTRFGLYAEGQSVGDYIKAGGTFGDLSWDIQRQYISLDA